MKGRSCGTMDYQITINIIFLPSMLLSAIQCTSIHLGIVFSNREPLYCLCSLSRCDGNTKGSKIRGCSSGYVLQSGDLWTQRAV